MIDQLTIIIILTLLVFLIIAALLLGPVWVFLKREEKVAEAWTRELLRRENGEEEHASNAWPDQREGGA